MMSSKFQPINRDTPCLLPPSVQDWLPEKHLARFVVEIVDQLERSGNRPYISDHREPHNLPWDERFETPAPCPRNADAVTTMAHR